MATKKKTKKVTEDDIVLAVPSVELIAHTALAEDTAATTKLPRDPDAHDAEHLIEFAGRVCYESHHRPNPATATNVGYLNNTLFKQKHWSIAEHATASFYIEGVSRSFLAELTRHRHLSFSVLSQRFVDESESRFVVPPAMYEKVGTTDSYGDELEVSIFREAAAASLNAYNELVKGLRDDPYLDLSRKQLREAARSVLMNATEVKMVVSGNLRAWHEVTQRRMKPDADAEINLVCNMIYHELSKHVSPTLFPPLLESGHIEDIPDLSQRYPHE